MMMWKKKSEREKRRYSAALLLAVLAGTVMLTSGCYSAHKEYEAPGVKAEAQTETQTETQTEGTVGIQKELFTEQHGNEQEADGRAQLSEKELVLTAETAPAMTETDEIVYVTGDRVNVRTSGSMSGQIIASVNRGEKLQRTGFSDTWSRVRFQGRDCYIATRYVSTAEPQGSAGVSAVSGDTASENQSQTGTSAEAVTWNSSWKYAEFSKINTGTSYLYRSEAANRKGITVCVNAGHGTSGGSSVKTLCHPDGTPKVTGGTTGAGATQAAAVSGGMTFSDGTAEAKVTLAMAKKFKEKLLAAGYDVLMIRESDDVQLDNIARTVIANNRADCHIALHWDSTASNKGAFYMSVPNVSSYRNMEPVKSNWEKHNALGENLVAGLKDAGVKIFSGGFMEMDLTQTSFSTVPSIDIELGDKASDHSDAALDTLAQGLLDGVNRYFGQ